MRFHCFHEKFNDTPVASHDSPNVTWKISAQLINT